jgi:beta-glucosidase
VLAGLEPHLPQGWQDDFDLIAQPIDWVGLNYYTCKRIAAAPDTPWPHLSEHVGGLPRTQMGWEIYPQGLGDFVRRMHREYTGDLPIYITENGMANNDHVVAGEVNDTNRIAYLDDHLTSVREAIEDGAPVRGYFCWSLLDNYEWSLGYEKRFGLVHVDFESLKRTPKASYDALRLALSQ